MNEFGNHLYALRRDAGLTQQELAEKLGVTNRTISKWETGETFPETSQLVPLADLFHVTVDELLRGCGSVERTAPDTAGALPSSEQFKEGVADANKDRSMSSSVPSPRMAAFIACGIGLILLGAAALTLLYSFWDSPYVSAVALGTLFGSVIAGEPLLIYGGITTQFGPYLKNDIDRKSLASFRRFVILGITVFLIGAALFTEGWLVRGYAEVLSIVLIAVGAVVAAIGCVPLVFGGIGWERHLQVSPHLKEAAAKTDEGETNGDQLAGKISSAIMIAAILAYLLMGVLGDLWHPGWIVFPAAALVCGMVSVFVAKK